jgi:FKBP-type peptidyl-prolyl cis-trans isomerase SlyD
MVQLQDGSGHRMLARVIKTDDVNVTLDANHPLAGETLNFKVTINEVRAALPDELAHGHVHGPGCHHHH